LVGIPRKGPQKAKKKGDFKKKETKKHGGGVMQKNKRGDSDLGVVRGKGRKKKKSSGTLIIYL